MIYFPTICRKIDIAWITNVKAAEQPNQREDKQKNEESEKKNLCYTRNLHKNVSSKA